MFKSAPTISALFVILSMSFSLRLNASAGPESLGESDRGAYTISSKDGLDITVQAYLVDDENAPFIILYHQAGWSRGEYIEIAPKLNELGYNCIAVDQRSGGEINGVKNETFIRAESKGLPTAYIDALPDIEAAMNHVLEKYNCSEVILWGSSYSAATMIYMAATYPKKIHSILSFAPGNYFQINGKDFTEYAKSISIPVFITSAKDEEPGWRPIFEAIPGESKHFYLPTTDGYHGSRALWEKHTGHELYWLAVTDFLKSYR